VVHRRMQASANRPRGAAPGIALAALMLLWSRSAFALDPSLDISQYAHTAWRIRDGFTRGSIETIAQTPDGYLWLGTDLGLLRFDGVRAVPWQPGHEQLPSDYIASLLVARDGTLWIGTTKGLASWRDGNLTRYPELAGERVFSLVQGRDGTVWFGTLARLCAVQKGKVQCEGDGSFGRGLRRVYEDHQGNLWVSAQTGLFRWKPSPSEHYSFPRGTVEANDFIEDDDGTLLLATNDGLKRLAGGKIQNVQLPGLDVASRPSSFFRSRDGSLWIGSFHGLLHLHRGKADVFGADDGLSADFISRIYQDREGNIWVGTIGGLDRFREDPFPSIAAKQGLSSSTAWSVLAAPDGSVWIGASDGLNRWQNGRITFHGKQFASLRNRRSADVSSGAVPTLDDVPGRLALDDQGRLWTSTREGVLYVEGDRFVPVPGLPAGLAVTLAPDGHGSTWVSIADLGLFFWKGGDAVQQFPWTQFGRKNYGASALLPDASRGGLWLGFFDGGMSYLKDGQVLASYTAADGLGAGRVTDLRFGEQGTIWAATEGGLSRIRDGRVLTLTGKNGLPCDTVHWSIEDDDHFAWLYMPCGLVRVARSELDAWASDPKRVIQTTVFDASVGIRTVGNIGSFGPRVSKAPDGKIWFTHRDGVTLIDPRHLPHNDLPPPVHVEQITADGEVYDAPAAGTGRLRLPARVRDLDIEYTALSLVVPEKVRFKVKLEGQDKDWRELVNHRHVNYTNLPPKDYRFLVKACNNSGVWNEEGAALEFTIPPAFFQTGWFRALSVTAALALLWAAYRIRVGVLQRNQRLLERHQAEITALNERLMKAQEEERTRIAGELHDGVLQQLTTLTLNFGALKYQVPPGSQAKSNIAGLQDSLIQLGTDVRQLSHDLHPAALHEAGLPNALSSYCEEFSKTRGIAVSCEADQDLKELSPGAALALYRIAQEALGNVAKHSKAKQVQVRLVRTNGVVRLTVSDDGVGFVPGRAGDSGGVGLVNMRERLRQLTGTLELESQPGRGATISAEVPFRST
jgi:signal transduction histidine kinase/ligand-binding sensor domain-containing protein